MAPRLPRFFVSFFLFARRIQVLDTERYRCLVVSPRPFFVFTPMLCASALGAVEYRSITEPVRAANPTARKQRGLRGGALPQGPPGLRRSPFQRFGSPRRR